MSSISLWFQCPLLVFTSRTSTQLKWEIIKRTHQTCCLLKCQSSGERLSLNMSGSQTRWREATQTCMCFNIWQEFSYRDERLGLAVTPFIFSKTAAIAQLLWWTNWIHVLTLMWRFCTLTGNDFSNTVIWSLVFLKQQHPSCLRAGCNWPVLVTVCLESMCYYNRIRI